MSIFSATTSVFLDTQMRPAIAPERPQLAFEGREPETEMTGKSIESYIAGLPRDVAFIMERVRETIREIAPDVTETIKYDMPLFQYSGAYLYVGAWKKHLGLYPIYPAAPELEAEMAPYRAKKDTVQFKYRDPIPYELIGRIATARIKQG
jgi:uncharacterized protein YdhG (YjbR/CyaY superfamily)